MERAEAIARLMRPRITEPQGTKERARCLVALGVTVEELRAARDLVTQQEIRELRAQAAARAATPPPASEWDPDPADPATPEG